MCCVIVLCPFGKDAVKREVLEEAGLEFEPLTLLCMKCQVKRNWFRLIFVGRMKGNCCEQRFVTCPLVFKCY